MRPLHPCPSCGHETGAECRAISLSVPVGQRFRCPHCLDDCLIATARAEGRGAIPSRPVPEPYVPPPHSSPAIPVLRPGAHVPCARPARTGGPPVLRPPAHRPLHRAGGRCR